MKSTRPHVLPTVHASKPTASKHAERLAQKAKYDRRAAKVQEGWREYESLTGKFTVSNRKGKQS